MKITLPPRITRKFILHLLDSLNKIPEDMEGGTIHADCSAVSFADPVGLCVLYFWTKSMQKKNNTVKLENLRYAIESWAKRMHLFSMLNNLEYSHRTDSLNEHDQNGNMIELMPVSDTNEVDKVSFEIANAIAHGITGISFEDDPDGMLSSEGEAFIDFVSYMFSEIIFNSLTHGRRNGHNLSEAVVAAQYYSSGILQIAIVDNGCGLLGTLRNHESLSEKTDHGAILSALEPRVSCNRDLAAGLNSSNQGIGLTVSTRMAVKTGGSFGIFTGNCLYGNINNRVYTQKIPEWKGTGVFFEINRSALVPGNKIRQSIISEIPSVRSIENTDSLISFD